MKENNEGKNKRWQKKLKWTNVTKKKENSGNLQKGRKI